MKIPMKLVGGEMTVHHEFTNHNQPNYTVIDEPEKHGWEEEYWKEVFSKRGSDIPMPIMYKGEPYFRGSLWPDDLPRPTNDDIYIASFKAGKIDYFLVNVVETRPPTTQEYQKYFRKHIKCKTFVIRNKHHENGSTHTELVQCSSKTTAKH